MAETVTPESEKFFRDLPPVTRLAHERAMQHAKVAAYARGVEDSAMVVDAQSDSDIGEASVVLDYAADAIRRLIPNQGGDSR